MSALLEELEVRVSSCGCDIRIEASGAIDIASVDVLRDVLDAAVLTGSGRVDLDLSATSFCDSVGLFTLLEARRRLGDRSRQLHIVGASRPVLRLLQLTGTADLFATPERQAVPAARPAVPTDGDGA